MFDFESSEYLKWRNSLVFAGYVFLLCYNFFKFQLALKNKLRQRTDKLYKKSKQTMLDEHDIRQI